MSEPRKLPMPLKDVLRDASPDEPSLDRMWAAVNRRPRAARRWQLLLATSLAAAAVALWLRLRPSPTVALAVPTVLEQGDGARREVFFEPGVQLALLPATRLEPVDSDAEHVNMVLRVGGVQLDLKPGGRRWQLVSRRVTVESSGASFAVYRMADGVRLEVYEGAVVVRGDDVPDGVRRLNGGEVAMFSQLAVPAPLAPAPWASPIAPAATDPTTTTKPATRSPLAAKPSLVEKPSVVVKPTAAASSPATNPPATNPPATNPPATIPPTTTPATTTPAATADPKPAPPTWQQLASQRRWREAYRLIARDDLDTLLERTAAVEERMLLADVLRLTRHPEDAVTVLTAVTDAAQPPKGAVAAFLIGRISYDELHRPADAAAAFSRALELGLPHTLAEEVYPRLVEAQLANHDRHGAATTAAAYRAKYPAGVYERRIVEWMAR